MRGPPANPVEGLLPGPGPPKAPRGPSLGASEEFLGGVLPETCFASVSSHKAFCGKRPWRSAGGQIAQGSPVGAPIGALRLVDPNTTKISNQRSAGVMGPGVIDALPLVGSCVPISRHGNKRVLDSKQKLNYASSMIPCPSIAARGTSRNSKKFAFGSVQKVSGPTPTY